MSIQYDEKNGWLEIMPENADEERALLTFYIDHEAGYNDADCLHGSDFFLPKIIEEGESEPSNKRFLRVSIPIRIKEETVESEG